LSAIATSTEQKDHGGCIAAQPAGDVIGALWQRYRLAADFEM
jgi:hypothetical protein